MYKDLSLKEKAKVIREGVRLGLNSIDDIQNLYDEAISYQKGGPIVTPYGQWQYPGRDTIIPFNNITMDNVNYPVLGVSDAGDAKVMMPWNDYKFRGSIVYEHPLIGHQAQEGKKFNRQKDLDIPFIIQKVNKSNADFVQRLKDPNRDYIQDWENPNIIATHKLSWADDGIVYPQVQNINGRLIDFSRPPYSIWAGYDNAIRNGDTIHMTPEEAEWFTTHYKDYYPRFNEYNKGGSIHIKPENRGKFTALKKRTGHSASWFKAHGTPAQKKMATFELNARHWKHDDGGHLFQEDGQIFKRPQDDLTGRSILTSPILPPKSYYEQFTIPELEPKKPQPLQPLEGTYGNKYSELIPTSDGTYVNNPINKGLQQDWRTHALEFAPFLAIGAGPAIGSTATWLATSKPALYNLGRMTIGSEIGGRGVDLASNLFTGNTWGQNVGNVVEGITGWNPNNTIVGQFVTDLTNPGYSIGLGKNIKLKKDIDPNKLFSYSEAEYIKPEDFPQVNIFKNQKPKLDVENYLQKHKQRIVDKYGEDAYNKIKQYTYNQDEKSIKKAIRDAIWDDTHNLIYALDNNFINQKYKELAKQPAFNIGRQAIVVNPELTKKIYPSVFELYGDDAALGLIKSHELEHAINWYRQMHPDQKATNGLFDLTKILKDSTKNYFEKQNNTELSARGSQIKDYFDSDIISGDQLRFAARNYVKDTGIDNDMTAFFNGIKDWDGMAKWITKNSSIIATPFLIGNIMNKYDKDQKNNQIYY